MLQWPWVLQRWYLEQNPSWYWHPNELLHQNPNKNISKDAQVHGKLQERSVLRQGNPYLQGQRKVLREFFERHETRRGHNLSGWLRGTRSMGTRQTCFLHLIFNNHHLQFIQMDEEIHASLIVHQMTSLLHPWWYVLVADNSKKNISIYPVKSIASQSIYLFFL